MRNSQRVILLSIFGVLLLSSCQEEEKPLDNSSEIIGYWKVITDVEEGVQIYDSYAFFENGEYNRSTAYINSDLNSLLGYSGKSSGTFTLLDDVLSTQTTSIYRIPESEEAIYLPNEMLVKVADNYSSDVNVEFSDDKNQMTWVYPPCGPLENCIGSVVFERYTPLDF